MSRPQGVAPVSNQQIGQFLLTLCVGLVIVHAWIVFVDDNEITFGSMLLLAVVAIGWFLYRWRLGTALRQRPYSDYLLHVSTYLLVNGSYWLHAAILIAVDGRDAIDESWTGTLLGLGIIWGIGLLIHTFGTLVSQGNEHAEI